MILLVHLLLDLMSVVEHLVVEFEFVGKRLEISVSCVSQVIVEDILPASGLSVALRAFWVPEIASPTAKDVILHDVLIFNWQQDTVPTTNGVRGCFPEEKIMYKLHDELNLKLIDYDKLTSSTPSQF